MRTILVFSVLLFSGCQKPSAPKPVADAPAFREPTATEVFNLRSRCAEFGEKIMNRNIIGPELAQDQRSHYDPKTNRCYVELSVNMADLTKYEDYYSRFLFDGQTGELLASVQSKKGVKTAFLKDGLNTLDYEAAIMKIDTLMADDRKQ